MSERERERENAFIYLLRRTRAQKVIEAGNKEGHARVAKSFARPGGRER